MSIKYKIALYYSLSAVLLLVTFASFSYYFSAKMRTQEYTGRLTYRAESIAKVLGDGAQIKSDVLLLDKLDQTAFQDLFLEEIMVYDPVDFDLVYTNIQDKVVQVDIRQLELLKREKYMHKQVLVTEENAEQAHEFELVGIYDTSNKIPLLVLVSAYDKFGHQNLTNLKRILLIELAVCVALLVAIGFFFAKQMVQPIIRLVRQVDKINVNNLQNAKVNIRGKNEIAQLAVNFNTMLHRLGESFNLQKSFVSNASHELRTPLAAIISQLQVAIGKDRTAEDYKQILQSVLEDAENLSELTNGLLQLAQSELGEQHFKFQAVRIDELLLDVPNLVNVQDHKKRKIEISFERMPEQDDEITCPGNESLLKILFLNLVDNACKFSPQHKALVSIDFDDSYITVKVQDDGIGIPPADLQNIFEPFYRGENTVNVRGHGLGLSICKKIVQLHRGQITVESKVGHGTTFHVKLRKS
ncbi:sensor histidine kinase [Chitinophaga caeni]|uniref:sensor histidine kinase n=1 Tax=Chitinophaga caeni TaxID=2029983 RepID=UPI0012FE5E90|nr:sensor histidine kinase [Chitinophaga caeni]